MWELLVLIVVIVAVHWWEYCTSVQEYTFAQPTDLGDLSRVIQEKTPIAIEIGSLPWRPEVVDKSSWKGDGQALAEQMELTTGLTDLDVGRPWWWLPELRDATVEIMTPESTHPLTWISAERRWIGCSHGGPITLWLVHSRYRRFLPSGPLVNPWALTVAEAPWIGRVQYIEVTVKPGWCIGLPAHWGYAVRADVESWIWSADQHSLMSFAINLPVYTVWNMLGQGLDLWQ